MFEVLAVEFIVQKELNVKQSSQQKEGVECVFGELAETAWCPIGQLSPPGRPIASDHLYLWYTGPFIIGSSLKRPTQWKWSEAANHVPLKNRCVSHNRFALEHSPAQLTRYASHFHLHAFENFCVCSKGPEKTAHITHVPYCCKESRVEQKLTTNSAN